MQVPHHLSYTLILRKSKFYPRRHNSASSIPVGEYSMCDVYTEISST
jgi:hypothetical protein